jgi:hypothetical protein
VSEHDEFAAVVQAAIAAEQGSAAPAAPAAEEPKAPPVEAPAEPAAAAADSGNAEVAKEEPAKEPPKEEAKPVEAAPAEKPKTDWKAAAAAERQKRAQAQQAKQNASQLSAQLEEANKLIARYKAIEAKKDTDPLGAIEDFGISYDKATSAYVKSLEQGKNTPQVPDELKTAIQKIHQLEGTLSALQDARVTEQRSKVISEFEAETKRILETKADDFELTKTAEEGLALVKSIVGEHWRATAEFDSQGRLVKDGETMPTEEACKLAEEYFEQKQLKRFAETKKFKALAKPAEAAKKPDAKPATTTLSQSMRLGGAEQVPTFGSETEELLSMIQRLQAQGN